MLLKGAEDKIKMRLTSSNTSIYHSTNINSLILSYLVGNPNYQ